MLLSPYWQMRDYLTAPQTKLLGTGFTPVAFAVVSQISDQTSSKMSVYFYRFVDTDCTEDT